MAWDGLMAVAADSNLRLSPFMLVSALVAAPFHGQTLASGRRPRTAHLEIVRRQTALSYPIGRNFRKVDSWPFVQEKTTPPCYPPLVGIDYIFAVARR